MANEKDHIKREDLRNSILKEVIIRADFTSILAYEEFLERLRKAEWFAGVFGSYDRVDSTPSIFPSDRTSYSSDGLDEQWVDRFSHPRRLSEKEVTMDFSRTFICIDIQCDKDYTTIDEYLKLMVQALELLFDTDPYVKFRRLGLRKIDGLELNDWSRADDVFEYFDQNVIEREDALFDRMYTDKFARLLSFPDGQTEYVKVIYTRKVHSDFKDDQKITFLIDIDTYKDVEVLSTLRMNRDELYKVWRSQLNEVSFDLFKKSVKLEFLNDMKK